MKNSQEIQKAQFEDILLINVVYFFGEFAKSRVFFKKNLEN